MATLAELYVRLNPYEASEGEYERLSALSFPAIN
jgi:hypothetical protein